MPRLMIAILVVALQSCAAEQPDGDSITQPRICLTCGGDGGGGPTYSSALDDADDSVHNYSNDHEDSADCSGTAQHGQCWMAVGTLMYRCESHCSGVMYCDQNGNNCHSDCDVTCWTSQI